MSTTGLVPKVTYYSQVALEVGKFVVNTRGMNPPSSAVFQSYLGNALKTARSSIASAVALPGASSASSQSAASASSAALQSARSFSRAQITSAAVVVAEVIGFFTIGEMLGRFKVVGYRSTEHGHAAGH